MRINDVKYGLNPYQNQINRNKTNTNKASNKDVVNISSSGQEIYQAMKSDQADRQKRIEQLKEQVSNGTYQVDSQKVAQKMLDFWDK
ncbi:flagellar biosynthesis anti-sigma factor FlgM [Bacillus sp. BRMEA1]|uniref:flagellar biosynthesis anti-sigma factor FlgM n=1 Tax=Neobacillus endophyticus TaxID=2738405 RepID=UPI0015674A40|nr:flagellar biosynthesis anti-sigma factor FlgM [Neobacillus endophyticus]NRD79395.1 flagellar biosynthesis anti-sigma factor FlgM [Neobacillus endophyticus]